VLLLLPPLLPPLLPVWAAVPVPLMCGWCVSTWRV
jgi:hypothetical protein